MRIALEVPRLGVGVVCLALAGASIATCSDREQTFAHRFTLESAVGDAQFGYDASASGARVVVGDSFDCTGDDCNGSIRILRVAGKRLVEEAKFYGESLYAYGGPVAMFGDRVATANDDVVHVYERDVTWKLAARVPFAECGDGEPSYLALEKDTLVAASYVNTCVWERVANEWRLTSRLTDEWNATQPIISAGVIAIGAKDSVQLFRRGAAGYGRGEDIYIERPAGMAIANGTLVVESAGLLHVYDVSQPTPRKVAALLAQSSDEDAGYAFGNEIALDTKTLAASGDDGVHVYQRSGVTWKPTGIIPARRPRTHDRFGITLALGDDVLWIGDPNTQRDDEKHRSGGYVHGYARR